MKIKQFMSVCFAASFTVGFVSGSATEVKEDKVYEVGIQEKHKMLS
ncbi:MULTISPECIES: hypothetical protein [Bacillus cereus group]|nr:MULTISPECIES: hypothetical protein [Bacillus cereus group]MDH2864005.1 hypothetical protein [Bacillus cytotoxicus]MDH2883595.1 hypothetical protein [Bacillus cytotoxicus]